MNRRAFITTGVASGIALSTATDTARAQKSPSRLRVAVIGHTGRGYYGHGLDTMWKDLPETEIVAVADADPKGLQTELAKLKVQQGFADYRQMLKTVKPDIVAVCPRDISEHHDMALAAIEAGAKGIYMEKPACRTLAEADSLVAACEKHGARLALAHRNRYHPVLPVVAQLIKDGAIGTPLEIRARGKEDNRGGSLDLWVLGSHLFNLIHYFAGEPKACSATILQDGSPITKADVKDGSEGVGPLAGNEIHARFEMQNGLPAFFDSVQNKGLPEVGFGIQIIGTKGIIDFRIDIEPLAQILAGSPFGPNTTPRNWVPISTAGIGKPEPIEKLKKLVAGHILPGRDLIAAIQENREPLCSIRDARVVLEMTMGIFESQRLNGQRVPLPLTDRGHPLQKI